MYILYVSDKYRIEYLFHVSALILLIGFGICAPASETEKHRGVYSSNRDKVPRKY